VLDLGIDLNVWPWVWLGIAVLFAIIELTALAGSFVLLPFAVSAFAASLLGFYDVPIEIQWFVFAVGGAVLWILLYRYARRFAGENELEPGVGADRLIGLEGIVTTAVDPDDTDRRGRVTAHGEIWGAISGSGRILPVGTHVRVTAVNGTKVTVEAVDADDAPPTTPPIAAPPDTARPTSPPSSPPPSSPPPSSSPPEPPPPSASPPPSST
jgi:membrane protein implicated in regulation of membrane protease activity